MRLIFGSLLMMLIAAITGLGLTWFSATHGAGFGALQIGPWTALPRTGTTAIDPYARAQYARSGALPLGSGDGVAFVATRDKNGLLLDGRCNVVVSGSSPPARYWTLTLNDARGHLVDNSLGRFGFTSSEVARDAEGRFQIALAPRARAGNWLPTAGIGHYMIVMRFYDTSIGVSVRSEREAPMPAIDMRDCP